MDEGISQKRLNNPTVNVYSLGCVENQLDGKRMERFFEANGWRVTDDPAEADLVLVNSCGYTGAMENCSLDALYSLRHSLKPGAHIHLVGCLPAIHTETVNQSNGLKIIPRNLEVLNELINAEISIEEVEANELPPEKNKMDRFRPVMIGIKRGLEVINRASPWKLPRALRQFQYISDDRAYYIKISVGCLGRCSFCAVRRAKGKLSSRDPEQILKEFDNGLAQGQRDFILSADESGSYGRDRGTTLAELLKEFLKRSSNYRILLRNLDPEWLIKDQDNLIPVFQTGRFPYIVAPVQSGSQPVLSLMDRGYTTIEAAETFARLRIEVPEMILRTHFIVGFPGETEEQFKESLEYARALRVDHFKVHEYSPRPHTRAALLPNRVPTNIVHRRARKMRLEGLKIFGRSFFN